MLSRLMTVREQLVVGFLGFSIVAGAGALFWTQRGSTQPDPIIIEQAPVTSVVPVTPAPTPTIEPVAPKQVVVSVQGAVIKPGVYHLDEGSRVTDLIEAAGGVLGADTADINLAALLVDGTTLTLPERLDESNADAATAEPVVNPAAYTISGQGTLTANAAKPQNSGSANGRINVNSATQVELETLPGIGPKLAQQIIQYREGAPFANGEALMDVPGIGPQKYEAVRDLITVE